LSGEGDGVTDLARPKIDHHGYLAQRDARLMRAAKQVELAWAIKELALEELQRLGAKEAIVRCNKLVEEYNREFLREQGELLFRETTSEESHETSTLVR
jgi:hypothetical protein